MDSRPLLFPQKLHFSCHMCSGCCRNWDVLATQAEVDRFRDHDWKATRPRFEGREILNPAERGLYKLAHIEDACIFLDEDNLCAIHKELGSNAKPLMCKHFPYHLTDTPEGVIVSLDFGCPTVVADEGAPIESHAGDVRARIEDWNEVGAQLQLGMPGATLNGKMPRVEAQKGVRLEWADYLALEEGFFRLLTDGGQTLTQCLLLLDALAVGAAAHAAPGEMRSWVDALAEASWEPLRTSTPRVSPLRQRALLAAIVASIEEQWGKQLSGAKGSGLARVGLALTVTASSSPMTLPTGGATLQLPRMLRTRFAQDDPELNAPIARFLTAFIARKGLVTGTTLLQGSRHLALYFAIIRWYSVARAVLAEREAVEPTDVRYALMFVEKTLSHSPALKEARFTALINFLFDKVAPACSLYPSTYPN